MYIATYILFYNCTGTIIEGLSNVIYYPNLTSLPIELICNVTGVVTVWRVNGTSYTRNDLTNGRLPGHSRTGANILVNSPVNNTEYICVFLDDDDNEVNTDPILLIIAGEYNKCQIFVLL